MGGNKRKEGGKSWHLGFDFHSFGTKVKLTTDFGDFRIEVKLGVGMGTLNHCSIDCSTYLHVCIFIFLDCRNEKC